MFRPHIGSCINSHCGRTEVLIPVKSGECCYCHNQKKQMAKRAAGKKTYTYIKKVTGEGSVFLSVLQALGDEPARCFVCGTPIALVQPHNFAHILSKNKYPLFRLNPDNIKILCFNIIEKNNGCHYKLDMTPKSELVGEGWERLFELQEQLKEEYKHLPDDFKLEINPR